MKRLVTGILAHVDSGKTTLSEGLLYTAGEINKLGRVDHRDAFLDTNEIERDRGITIFSKQAVIKYKDSEFTLLDTPGHVDFSAETERTMCVLDYAILVISASDGVQSHTQTLWKLLTHYNIPVFIFINKMDLPDTDRLKIIQNLKKYLGDGCIDFTEQNDTFYESIAMTDDSLLDEFLNTQQISDEHISDAISRRKVFPCFFGSALKTDGVKEFLDGLNLYTKEIKQKSEFGAKIFKIAEDEKGQRLTYMKITGGSLKVKAMLSGNDWQQKANEVRIYSGVKYNSVQEAFQGSICAVTGLGKTYAGEGLGFEQSNNELLSEPVFSYNLKLPEDRDIHSVLSDLKKLEDEETQLHILWNEQLQKITVQLMGEIQLEVLKRILDERFGLKAEFEQGSIIYKETIADIVEGVGHYEPLRHYAEVHLLIEPAKRGSGITVLTKCSEDVLNKNWQRLIVTHLLEKTHIGVLTGSPITDVKITVINGRAHQKHTEGGDFREATYRAVRHGLMNAKNILLEPWYNFSLEIPTTSVGRAMTDLQQMGAQYDTQVLDEATTKISGFAPISCLENYQSEVTAYTKGRGRISCSFKGYEPCHNTEEVIEKIGYMPESDIINTADSVFCSHGSEFLVKWDKVYEYMHIPKIDLEPEPVRSESVKRSSKAMIADEDELLRIFEMTYGKVTHKMPTTVMRTQKEAPTFKSKPQYTGPHYLLIDGYNVIFACEELKEIADENLDDARLLLIRRVSNYQAVRKNKVILVFDAYKVKGAVREIEKHHGITVVYTKEAETADSYIEKTSEELSRHYRVRVATSDRLEQIIIFGNGAERIPAKEFYAELTAAEEEIKQFIKENNKSV